VRSGTQTSKVASKVASKVESEVEREVGVAATVATHPTVRSAPSGTLDAMSNVAAEPEAPRAHARIVYLSSVAPHWEVYGDWGERQTLDEFRARALARLVLLPRDDPQFRRNKERINRDAERELISLEWELGIPEDTGER
jgi:hypothetical protein